MNDVVTQEKPGQVIDQASSVGNMLVDISKMFRDPTTDPTKLHSLLDFQERLMNKQAELDFNAALSRAQIRMPRIAKNGEIKNKAGHVVARFMKYEDIDEAIRGIYQDEGFSVQHDREDQAGKMIITTWLRHIGGHKEKVSIPLPYDQPNAMKSALQAAVSTFSVGKRVNVCSLFNIVAEGDDDDGANANKMTVTEAQASEIRKLIIAGQEAALLDWLQVSVVEDIPITAYDMVIQTLKRKATAQTGTQS